MGMTMKVEDIKLENGNATTNRTVMSETDLKAGTLVEHIETVSRMTGTAYKNSIYRVLGTDDALIIRHNDGPTDNIYWDNAVVRRGYFSERREFAQRIGTLSNKYRIPFEVCLAIGDNEELYPLFLAAVSNLDNVSIKTMGDLNAGIWRRKNALLNALGDHLYDLMKIEEMGQRNSSRLAQYVAKRCREAAG